MGWLIPALPWIVAGVVIAAILGFLRPVVEVVTKTWTEAALPLLKSLLSTTIGQAVAAGLAFVLWTFLVWHLSDGWGYARAKSECDTEIAMRERDALAQENKTLRERLASLDQIRLKDATQALADAETQRQNQADLDALPNPSRLCLDESDARSLWGPRPPAPRR